MAGVPAVGIEVLTTSFRSRSVSTHDRAAASSKMTHFSGLAFPMTAAAVEIVQWRIDPLLRRHVVQGGGTDEGEWPPISSMYPSTKVRMPR